MTRREPHSASVPGMSCVMPDFPGLPRSLHAAVPVRIPTVLQAFSGGSAWMADWRFVPACRSTREGAAGIFCRSTRHSLAGASGLDGTPRAVLLANSRLFLRLRTRLGRAENRPHAAQRPFQVQKTAKPESILRGPTPFSSAGTACLQWLPPGKTRPKRPFRHPGQGEICELRPSEIEAIVADRGYHPMSMVTLAAELRMRPYTPRDGVFVLSAAQQTRTFLERLP